MLGRRSLAGLLAIIIMMTCTPWLSRAQGLSKGTVEITPALSFSHNSFSFSGTDLWSISTLLGSSQVGYCLTDVVEVSGGPMVSQTSVSSPGDVSDSVTQLGFIGGFLLNLGGGERAVPFLHGAFGFQTNSGGDESTGLMLIAEGGVRMLVGDSASLNFGLGYQHLSNALGIKDLSASTFALGVGVSLLRHREL